VIGCDRGHADAGLAPEVACKRGKRSFAARIDDEVNALVRERDRNRTLTVISPVAQSSGTAGRNTHLSMQ
jgi:hypothetical protein